MSGGREERMIYHNWRCTEGGADGAGETVERIPGVDDCDQSIAEPGLQPLPEDYG